MDALLYFLLAAVFTAVGFRVGWIFWIVAVIFLWAAIQTLVTA
jgi:hypothetical protein